MDHSVLVARDIRLWSPNVPISRRHRGHAGRWAPPLPGLGSLVPHRNRRTNARQKPPINENTTTWTIGED